MTLFLVDAKSPFVSKTELPKYYQPWMETARNVPKLIDSHSLRTHIHQMPLLETHFMKSHRELRLAHLALSVMTMGYVWQEGDRDTVKVLPRILAVPYCEVSQRLGLPPILTHADAVLANWKKKDPQGNLELLLSLPGGESVRGFFLVTMLVELAAVPGVKAIPKVIAGVRQGEVATVTRALDSISLAINGMKEAFKLMHGVHLCCRWKDNPCMAEGLVYEGVQAEPMEFSGGSAAQSSLLHCFDELLGVKHETKSGTFLTRMRDYMPPAHKQLIQDISSHRPSLRDFVLERNNAGLVSAFDRCVSQLVSFRSYHINVVSRFIAVPAARAKQLRSQDQGSEPDQAIIGKAPTALEERGTGGSAIMSLLKTARDQTSNVTIHGPLSSTKTSDLTLISELSSRLSL
uniref:Indoleamine 2,3-dioxygenase 2-like n=1 Tax=Denticeps clupeoides TaxID=299321 RepID=A0AAY4ATK2_9TELE